MTQNLGPSQIFFDWMDLIWVPVAFFVAHKGHRIKTVFFILACVAVLRLQVDVMAQLGYPTGILTFFDMPLLVRGYILYGLFIALFLVLARLSRGTNQFVFLAATISTFLLAFCISSVVMLL